MTGPRTVILLALAAAGPVVLATLALAVFSMLETRGNTPLSIGPARNIAEAAALAHGSEVLRLLRSGQDPNQIWTVRREIISSAITKVTALEAAVYSRKGQVIELLDQEGAIVDERSRRDLACLAIDLQVEEIVRHLTPDGRPDCEPGRAAARVLARSDE